MVSADSDGMSSGPSPGGQGPASGYSAGETLRVLEVLSRAAKVDFDRVLASRILGEAQRAVPGEGEPAWSRRLAEVGESLHLRLMSFECTLGEALACVRQGAPAATIVPSADGGGEWFVLAEVRGRRVRLASVDAAARDRWLGVSELRRALGASRATRLRWLLGQQALPCDLGTHQAEEHSEPHELTPLARLIGLIRPERRDLWAIFVFSLMVGLLTLAAPIAVEALVNTVAFGRYVQPIIVLAILLFAFLAFAAALRGLLVYMTELMQRRLFVRVVEDLAYRVPRVRQTALDGAHGPELLNRFFEAATLQKAAALLLLDGTGIVLQTIVGMLVLAFYHPFLLGFDVALLALMAFAIFALGRGAVHTAIKESKAKYAIAAWLQELARHPTAFKLHAGAQFGLDRADHLAVHWLEQRRAHFRVVMRQTLFALGLQAVAATVLLGLGGWLVIRGQLTLGQLVAAELIVMLIVSNFAKLGKHMESVYDLLASVVKLGRLFDLPIEPHDNWFHLHDSSPARLTVRQACYGYDGQPVLEQVSLQVQPGESAALVGAPGCGKSTLLDLLCGVRQPTAGHIELDGIDLRELRPDSLREHLALARGTEIFRGTIGENVHLNRPHISALDVREAVSAVGLLDEVLHLPDGLNTALQTDGSPLSASQRQRLMLARAMVGRPRLLLIDSTLDGLADEVLATTLASIVHRDAPWTAVIATGRRRVIEACQQVISLSARSTPRAADLAKIAD